MSYRGTVKNGVVVLEPDAKLPEGMRVRIEPESKLPNEAATQPVPAQDDPVYRMYELAVDTGIPDLAVNADHYLYGHPKVRNAR